MHSRRGAGHGRCWTHHCMDVARMHCLWGVGNAHWRRTAPSPHGLKWAHGARHGGVCRTGPTSRAPWAAHEAMRIMPPIAGDDPRRRGHHMPQGRRRRRPPTHHGAHRVCVCVCVYCPQTTVAPRCAWHATYYATARLQRAPPRMAASYGHKSCPCPSCVARAVCHGRMRLQHGSIARGHARWPAARARRCACRGPPCHHKHMSGAQTRRPLHTGCT